MKHIIATAILENFLITLLQQKVYIVFIPTAIIFSLVNLLDSLHTPCYAPTPQRVSSHSMK